MASKVVNQVCAICEREKQNTNGITKRASTENLQTSPREHEAHPLRHKYNNLPIKKNDDFFAQVTEPQWLRRGNLKETDHVCKRHLAILMRGVDRGCEGGCCSPLHRGARLCQPGNMKSIPAPWRRRFMKHPKIKEEDKSMMLLCWDCYKKHMDRMSKYGDPMGRSFGNRRGIQRSNSLIMESDSGASDLLQAMKRYKSMDKLDSFLTSPTETSPSSSYLALPRRISLETPKQAGSANHSTSPGNDIRPSPSRRIARGRKINKGRRSPSPPDNISPVRASVVHSRRRHSPHKGSKSPIMRSTEIATLSLVNQNRSDVSFSTRTMTTISSKEEVDPGALADTESPRPAPVPPVGLFSPRSNCSDGVIDVFGTPNFKSSKEVSLNSKYPSRSRSSPRSELDERYLAIHHNQANGESHLEKERQNVKDFDTSTGSQSQELPTSHHTSHGDPNDQFIAEDYELNGTTSTEFAEEGITSADEMAGIFGDEDESNTGMYRNNDFTKLVNGSFSEEDRYRNEIDGVVEVHHEHESSGSSSDKTGETQIAVTKSSNYKSELDVDTADPGMVNANGIDGTENGIDEQNESVSRPDEVISGNTLTTACFLSEMSPETSFISNTGTKDSVFVSPRRRRDPEGTSPNSTGSILNYSLSPQSFRRLDSIKLSFSGESTEDNRIQRSNSDFGRDVREPYHPLRNHVLMKVPEGARHDKSGSSFIRVPAEDVEIYLDSMSFLEGITQTIGDDSSMYPEEDTKIVSVDLQKEENRLAHKTSQFAGEQLIVRRGQAFEIKLELNEVYDGTKHNVSLELLSGAQPRVSNGTHILLPIQSREVAVANFGINPSATWSIRLVKSSEKKMTLSVNPPSTCPVGSYVLCFQVERDGRRSRWSASCEDDQNIIVLFNPWCIDDAVFMSSQADRMEYVISDTGCIYTGNSSHQMSIPRIFGQYENGILPACMQLLDACDLTNSKRGDPVAVTRAICRLVSCSIDASTARKSKRQEESEICVIQILHRYWSTGLLSVPNDNIALQSLLITVFRCLGFPSRIVTCFECAIEFDIPLSVNIHYSSDGQLLDYLNTDVVRPSYCWTSVWMSRVDLPPGFGGWQAISASAGTGTSVGPTPVYAIKKGQTSCCLGTEMYFMALNANKKHWMVSHDGSMALLQTERNKTGTNIVTKSVGGVEAQDITKLYKFADGSEESKLALHAAYMHCGSQDNYNPRSTTDDIVLSLTTDPTVIQFGNDVDVITHITNKGHGVSHLTINVDGAVLDESGRPVLKLPRETILAEVLAKESVQIPVKVNLSCCLHKLTRTRHLAFTAFATVKEYPGRHLISTYLAGVEYPVVDIQVHGEFKIGGELTVSTRIRNPLPCVLRNARMNLTTSGLVPLAIASKSGKSVAPWQIFKSERLFRCQNTGKQSIVARFSSDNMEGPMGSQEIEIT